MAINLAVSYHFGAHATHIDRHPFFLLNKNKLPLILGILSEKVSF